MGSSSSRSASFSCPHGSRRRANDSTTSSPYDSIEDQRTLYCAADRDPPRWRRRKKHFLSANKSLAGRIAKHRKPVAAAAAAAAVAVSGAKGRSPVLAAPKPSSSSKELRRRKSTRKRNGCRARASDSGRGSDECDCGDGGGVSSDDAAADASLASCPYCNEEEEEEEFANLDDEKEFVKSSLLRIEATEHEVSQTLFRV